MLHSDRLVRPDVVTLLAVLHFVAAVGFGIVGLIVAVAGRSDTFNLIYATVLLGLAATHVACGLGLWRLRGYGRILQILFALLGMLGFPVGTLISILILIYMLSERARVLFSGKSLEQLTDAEAALLAREPSLGIVIGVVAALSVAALFWVGLVAAIAIPNFLNAVDRGRQKRTRADLRTIGTAIEMYSIDHTRYPTAGSIAELELLVAPKYVRALPSRDGWSHEFVVQSAPGRYVLLSPGKDGLMDGTEPNGPTVTFESDIVFSDGSFVQWPQGRQQ